MKSKVLLLHKVFGRPLGWPDAVIIRWRCIVSHSLTLYQQRKLYYVEWQKTVMKLKRRECSCGWFKSRPLPRSPRAEFPSLNWQRKPFHTRKIYTKCLINFECTKMQNLDHIIIVIIIIINQWERYEINRLIKCKYYEIKITIYIYEKRILRTSMWLRDEGYNFLKYDYCIYSSMQRFINVWSSGSLSKIKITF